MRARGYVHFAAGDGGDQVRRQVGRQGSLMVEGSLDQRAGATICLSGCSQSQAAHHEKVLLAMMKWRQAAMRRRSSMAERPTLWEMRVAEQGRRT